MEKRLIGKRLSDGEWVTSSEVATISPHNPRAVDIVREQAPLPGVLRGCRDCGHSVGKECSHPSFGRRKLNVFTGKVQRVDLPKWENMRSEGGACGPEGRLWTKCKPHQNHRTYGLLSLGSGASGLWLLFGAHSLWSVACIPLAIVFAIIYVGLSDE